VSTLETENVAQAYKMCADISQQFPSEKRSKASSDGVDDGSVQVKMSGTSVTTKLALLMYGDIIPNSRPFDVSDSAGNSVRYDSQSEADMALVTLLAMKYGDDAEKIDEEFRESVLYRPKWDRLAEKTIQKAIASAKRLAEKQALNQARKEAKEQKDAPTFASQVLQEEPEEDFSEKEETFPEVPRFTGALADLADAMFPSVAREFKLWGLMTRWGLMRSGLDTLENEPHIQPRFYTILTCYPNRGKTAANNETRNATDTVRKIALAEWSAQNNLKPTVRAFGSYERLESIESGQALTEQFWEQHEDNLKNDNITDKISRVIHDPDELSETFDKARNTVNRTSTLFGQLLKLHSGNTTENRTKKDGHTAVHDAHFAILGGTPIKTYKSHLWTGTSAGSGGLQSRFLTITTNAPRMPATPLPCDYPVMLAAQKRLARLLTLPPQVIRMSQEARDMLNTWWEPFTKGEERPSTVRILETVKQICIVLTVTNADDYDLANGLEVSADMMSQAIAFGEYQIAVREMLNPEDSYSVIQSMELAIIKWFTKHAGKADPKTRNDCRRGLHPQRLPGGLGAFKMGWDNCVNTGVLKFRDKGQREGRYSL
jgi:hypothetical protein